MVRVKRYTGWDMGEGKFPSPLSNTTLQEPLCTQPTEVLWRFHYLCMIVNRMGGEIPEGLSTQTLALSVQQSFLQGIEQDPF